MKKAFTLLILSVLMAFTASAQRKTDPLDRGVVAVDPRSGGGLFISWRVQADEYYGVTYNLYRNGTKLNSKPLTVSNYHDTSGNSSYTYTVKAVVNGVEQAESKPAKMFTTNKYTKNGHAGQPGHLRIAMKDVVDRNGNVIYSADGTICKWNYSLNDACLADLDGDGEVEVIIKRINETEESTSYPDGTSKELYETSNTTAYSIIEAYKLDGTRLWWIDCGPNMVSMNSVEINCVAYDWDEDGKAEVVMRGADNMIIHKADGTTYNVGDMSVNTRNDLVSHTNAQYAWTRTGAEYLLYLNGSTASPYQVIEYPLKRFESDEAGKTEQQVWSPNNSNGGYGHRSSKYFFGAPVLDGRHASIFLARGIYTQTKMVALDVNRSTHKLTQRWYWRDNTVGSSWFGQGNHNFSIADVDCDGCDEIIYGSMCIDNNGKGLSTTGLGHGDALHVGDLDPFTKGLEVFACNEENPGNNLRNATTSEIYYRATASGDDGRALMGNFLDTYPGCTGRSVSSGVISAASHSVIENYTADDFLAWSMLNGRIYWDGDLLEEMMASTSGSRNQPGVVYKPGNSRIMQTDGASTNNDTKKNHCAQGDIIGDWREEIIMRSSDDKALLVYSTDIATEYSYPSLWYDHAYRQAMVWQPCGYNQPPHTSFFLGELEGLTKAPVPYTMSGRTEISAGSNITSANNNQDIMLYGAGNFGVDGNNSPKNLFVNVPSTVSGNGNNSNISYSYSQAQLGVDSYKGDLTGTMNFVKQGDGLLKLTAREFSYTGNTDVFAGSLYFRGTLNSPVWMNRHTTLYAGGTYNSSVTMEYGSTLYITNNNSKSDGSAPTAEYAKANINTLNLHEGSRVVFDINASGSTDVLNLQTLSVRKQNWNYGPQYLAPVFQFNITGNLPTGTYPLGALTTLDGNLDDIIIEGITDNALEVSLIIKDGNLALDVVNNRGNYIGDEDNTTAFWGDFSDSYTIEPGYNYNFKFTNYGNTAQIYYNWILALVNGSGHSTIDRADYSEYLVLRADKYGWGDYYDSNNISTDMNMTTFKTDMTNAAVDMDVQFKDGVFTMTSTISCSNGKKYNYSFTSKKITADQVTMFFTVDHSHMSHPRMTVEELEPENEIGSSITYDFTKGSTTKDIVYLTASEGYEKVGQSGWAYASTYAEEIGDGIAFARLATSSKMYGFCYRYSGLLCIGQSHTLTVTGLKDGTKVEVYTSANAISSDYQGNLGGTWTSEVNSDATLYTYNMTSDGDLNLQFAIGAYVYKIVVTSPSVLTLQPNQADDYEAGIYQSVTLNRTFKAGYSTLCVPFNTTVAEFTGNDESAYVAYLSGAEQADGLTTLEFTNSTEIKANQPYIIYLSEALEAPSFKDKPVFAENAKTVTVGDWSMTGNYTPNKSMEGLYGVANNAEIRKGGSSSYINGFTAYLTGSTANARIRFSNGDETAVQNVNAGDPTITAIYTIGGTRVATLQKGVNLVRMSDNTVRKVFVK